jgi:hypothetical protein
MSRKKLLSCYFQELGSLVSSVSSVVKFVFLSMQDTGGGKFNKGAGQSRRPAKSGRAQCVRLIDYFPVK